MLALPAVLPSFALPVAPIAQPAEHSTDELRRMIDERLGMLLPAADAQQDRVAAAMRYGVLAPGKRVRPLLVLLAARGFQLDPTDVLDAACALEMVHAASLFLDDLPCMDDAKLRRSQPTVHIAFGEDVAMLASIALLARAWRITATAAAIPAHVRTEMVAVLSDAVGIEGLVTGQYRDLHAAAGESSRPHIARTNELKTGVLFAAAFDIAALAAGADAGTRGLLREAADALGQAFQLADDLADLEMEPATLGKDCHQDAGKSTLVSMVGPRQTRRILSAQVERAETLIAQAMPLEQCLPALVRTLFASKLH
ncbi:polyprenyl synthetase family protein [Acidovorax sp. Leaf160]|uniref:polyprenyl synthetase family protein n=1 Tax=Acidovorax sp. Leaf160 TaxID=1736280 RepID=UPI0009E70220|nr:polyprenyl synthetase family protein [Acidovorax sp. Leaf160]